MCMQQLPRAFSIAMRQTNRVECTHNYPEHNVEAI